MNPLEKLQGYRTLATNIFMFIIILGGALTGQIESAETLRIIALIMTVANVALRFISTTPAGKKEAPLSEVVNQTPAPLVKKR